MKTATLLTDSLLLVNAAHPISSRWEPDLVSMDPRWPKIRLERRTAGLLTTCIRAIGGQNQIVPVSGWRSQEEQQAIWDNTLADQGERFTRQYVALPGCSEHQTGLAVDLGQASEEIDFIRPDFPYDGVCGAFRRQAADFGFILRYPAGKETITGIAYEPWHFRYVGVPHARIMTDLKLTLEEYVVLLRRSYARQPLVFRSGTRVFRIRCYPEGEPLPPPEPGHCRQISADNCGGLVITDWR